MNRGLVLKWARETAWVTVAFAAALALFEGLIPVFFETFLEESAGQLLNLRFVQRLIQTLLGVEFEGGLDAQAAVSFAWVHPMVLVLTWGLAITICTRCPAGEIGAGTVDVLLGLPVSRWDVHLSLTVVSMAAGAAAVLAALAGSWLSGQFVGDEYRIPVRALPPLAANLFCLYAAVAAAATLVSSISSHRGRAVGGAFALVVGSFMLSVFAQFWPALRPAARFSVLTYYRPFYIIRDGWAWSDMATLFGAGAALWACAAVMFRRRDICTT
ncbi:MAG: hypothetical protein C4547_07660 [Phycisphaerales bacterium]|nr:MAG: hypothetical protein C4547_07660 [Phycisphaerales bacterium]